MEYRSNDNPTNFNFDNDGCFANFINVVVDISTDVGRNNIFKRLNIDLVIDIIFKFCIFVMRISNKPSSNDDEHEHEHDEQHDSSQ